eukprot:TRINITY_DN1285_c0_g1_i2.p1 TRINITY_DN1285_c0_g1~~TRINITY_DN1285_c0_g1_i2.p1  ORF type:complete len:446 (-),score=97.82 TRINITY_DN1285_c0_g1_i2:191-1528(-)
MSGSPVTLASYVRRPSMVGSVPDQMAITNMVKSPSTPTFKTSSSGRTSESEKAPKKSLTHPLLSVPGEILYVALENVLWSVYELIGEILNPNRMPETMADSLNAWLKSYLPCLKLVTDELSRFEETNEELNQLSVTLHQISKEMAQGLRNQIVSGGSDDSATLLHYLNEYARVLRQALHSTLLQPPSKDECLEVIHKQLLVAKEKAKNEKETRSDILYYSMETSHLLLKLAWNDRALLSSLLRRCCELEECNISDSLSPDERIQWTRKMGLGIREVISLIHGSTVPGSELTEENFGSKYASNKLSSILNSNRLHKLPNGFEDFFGQVSLQSMLLNGMREPHELQKSIHKLLDGLHNFIPPMVVIRMEREWKDEAVPKLLESLENLVKLVLIESVMWSMEDLTQGDRIQIRLGYQITLETVVLIYGLLHDFLIFLQEEVQSEGNES